MQVTHTPAQAPASPSRLLTLWHNILRHEMRLALRSGMLLLVSLVMAGAVFWALNNGAKWQAHQSNMVNAALSDEAERIDKLVGEYKEMLRGEYTPSDPFYDPSYPFWLGMRYAATIAVLPPAPLAVTAIAQSDLNPPYIKVSADNKEGFLFSEEIENASSLLSGRFDLSFVIVFLFPLALIALCYDLLSAEREQGTLALLKAQPVGLDKILTIKALSRFAFVILPLFVATALSLLWSERGFDGLGFLTWCLLVLLYGLFWLALTLWVNSFAGTSSRNALLLVGAWVSLCLVVPALLNLVAQLIYPIPPRAQMINDIRVSQIAAFRNYDATIAQFYVDHPENQEKANPDSKSDYADTIRRMLIVRAGVQQTNKAIEGFELRRAAQENAVSRLSFLSPTIVMTQSLAEIAGTSSERYRDFNRQVNIFQKTFEKYFFDKTVRDERIPLEEYANFPKFRYQDNQDTGHSNLNLWGLLLGLVAPVLLLSLLIYRKREAMQKL
jgi:ABC-2 type transport system permease protein